MAAPLPFVTRLWFAWLCFFKVLFDGDFASRAMSVRHGLPAPEPAREPEPEPEKPKLAPKPTSTARDGALQLLALFQREGRLVDFLEQDIAAFGDAEIGATARVIHEGCRKALRSHTKIEPLYTEDEGAAVTLEPGFDAQAVKLTGNVSGKGPWKGVVRHRGWKARELTLPSVVEGFDPTILCPAEVEL